MGPRSQPHQFMRKKLILLELKFEGCHRAVFTKLLLIPPPTHLQRLRGAPQNLLVVR
jgi:hypothetical protein